MVKEGKIQLRLGIAVLAIAVLALLLMQYALRDMAVALPGLPAAQAKVAEGVSLAAIDTAFAPASLCDIYSWSMAALDRPVRILGRLHICSGEEQWIPGGTAVPTGLPVLYRYVDSCCPAHAVPAVVELRSLTGQWESEFPQDSWVEASGYFQPTVESGAMPALRVQELSLADSPQQAVEAMFPPSKMAGRCQGSRPEIPYPPR